MLEQVSQLAEQAATNVSRRGFLGRFGRGALMTAGAIGAFLALPGEVSAGRGCPSGYRKCHGRSHHGHGCFECHPKDEPCPVVRCL